MEKSSLGDRMKMNYENVTRFYLTRRTPVIMRLDGQAFHTLTKKHCERPFDDNFQSAMISATKFLMKKIQGSRLAYIQSDEVSILITDFDRLETSAWFDYNVLKMCSIASATMAVAFNNYFKPSKNEPIDGNFINSFFDCRAFNIPEDEVTNYFIWRQKDWLRNSIQMYCRSFFSQKQMNGKKVQDMHEMLHSIGKNWTTDLKDSWKNGVIVFNYGGCLTNHSDIIFTENRNICTNMMPKTYE